MSPISKNPFSRFLVLAAVLFCLPLTPAAAQFEFTTSSNEVTITGYTGGGRIVSIPASLGGHPVRKIGDGAFANQITIQSLTIPSSVREIGAFAFNGCSGIFQITMNDGVASIGDFAFLRCSGLTTVAIPNSVSTLGANPFARCAKLEAITVLLNHPNFANLDGSVLSKDLSTFHCFPAGKATVSIPPSVTTIADGAFRGASKLTSVTIPDSVHSIGQQAFELCTSLTSVEIPDSVTSLGNFAFGFCTSLESVTIPGSVTSIGAGAFGGCTSLTSVTILDGVTSIGQQAFELCTSLTSVTIPDSVTIIRAQSFRACRSLTSVTIPDSVTDIQVGAFRECTSLTNIYFRGSPPTVGADIFLGVPMTTIVYSGAAMGWPGTYAGIPTRSNKTFHVDADSAAPAAPFDTWGKATRSLKDAILFTGYGDEIWVAAGTYTPDDGIGIRDGERTESFALKNGIAIIGGFAGGETDQSEADPLANETILSGHIAFGNNSLHVVTANSIDASASLRGFSITGGIADGVGNDSYGGGLYCFEASPIVEDCFFFENEADFGGAVLNENSSPTFTACTFERNQATVHGGAVHNFEGSASTISDCVFRDNQATSNGGAIINFRNSSPSIINCSFRGNSAESFGGALANDNGCSPTIINCEFLGNKAGTFGGALLNVTVCAPVVTNCSFQGNQSVSNGGAIGSFTNSTPTFQNCLVWRNQANGVTTSASASVFNDGTSTAAYRGCLIQNLNLGILNIDGTDPANDPLFVLEAAPAAAPSTGGDLRLQSGSPMLDQGVSALNRTASDLAGSPRIQGTGIDLGAFEFVEFTYTETDGEITITGYSGSGGEVTIPSVIEHLPVKAIGPTAFHSNTILTGVTIPDSVTSIGVAAFNAATSLERIMIGRGVTTIEAGAFAFCRNLPEFVIDEANPNFKISPDGVLFDKLGEILIAFPGGKAGAYDIPAGVTGIGASAFSGCVNLTEVTIPSTVTGIGFGVFDQCPSLTAIRTDVANPNLSSTPDGVLLSKDGTTLFAYPPGKSGASYDIPGGVEIIADFAFRLSTNLTSVMVPNTVTSIGRGAFVRCTNLIEIRFAGNAPTDGGLIFLNVPSEEARVYYFAGATGWGATYGGITTVEVGFTFGSWIAGFPGVGSETGIGDDPDRDGQTSGVENFYGTDPSVPSAGMVAVGKTGSTFTFTHPQGASLADDLVAGYQWTTDLKAFNADGFANPAGTTTVTFSSELDTPIVGTTTVTATITGSVVPESLLVRIVVAFEEG